MVWILVLNLQKNKDDPAIAKTSKIDAYKWCWCVREKLKHEKNFNINALSIRNYCV